MTVTQMRICRRQQARMQTAYTPPRVFQVVVRWFENATEQFGQLAGTLLLMAIELTAFIIYVYIDFRYISPQITLDDIDEYPIPRNLFYVQASFSFFFLVSWLVLLIGADESILKQLLSFRSLTTLVTALPQLLVFFWQFGDEGAVNGFVPMFLRIWWLHYYVRYLISLPGIPISELARDTIGVLSPLLAVMVTSAGIYSITVRFSDDRNITAFDAFYFSFVTFGTIGFGDLSPKTDYGYVLVICMIISAIYIFPKLFTQLTDIIQRRKLFTVFHKNKAGRHVIIAGHFRLQDVKFILRQFYTEERLFIRTKVVFLSPKVYDPEIYLFATSPLYSGSVSLIVGSPKVHKDLERCRAKSADAIFIMSFHGNFTEVDFENVSTVFALHHYDKSLPIHVSLKRATTRHFVSSTASVVMVAEIIKMNLLGLGAVLPGALPLIINLVRNYDNPYVLSNRLLEENDTSDEEDRQILENEETQPMPSKSKIHVSFAHDVAQTHVPYGDEEEHIITQEQIREPELPSSPKQQSSTVHQQISTKSAISKVQQRAEKKEIEKKEAEKRRALRRATALENNIAKVSVDKYAPWQILNGWAVGNELYTVPVPQELVGSEFSALSLAMAAYTVTIIGIVDSSHGVILNPDSVMVAYDDLLICIAQDITHIADGLQTLNNKILKVPEARFKDKRSFDDGGSDFDHESNIPSRISPTALDEDIEMSDLISIQVRKGNSRLVMRNPKTINNQSNKMDPFNPNVSLPKQQGTQKAFTKSSTLEDESLADTLHGRFLRQQLRELGLRTSDFGAKDGTPGQQETNSFAGAIDLGLFMPDLLPIATVSEIPKNDINLLLPHADDYHVSVTRRPHEIGSSFAIPGIANRPQTGQQTVLGDAPPPHYSPSVRVDNNDISMNQTTLGSNANNVAFLNVTLDDGLCTRRAARRAPRTNSKPEPADFRVFARDTAVWVHRHPRASRRGTIMTRKSSLTGWTRNIFGPSDSRVPSDEIRGGEKGSTQSSSVFRNNISDDIGIRQECIGSSDSHEEPERIESVIVVSEPTKAIAPASVPTPIASRSLETDQSNLKKAISKTNSNITKRSEPDNPINDENQSEEPFIAVMQLKTLREMRALSDHIVLIDLFSAFHDVSSTTDTTGDEARAIDLFTLLHPIKSRDAATPVVLLSMMEKNSFFEEIWEEHNYEPLLQITGCGAIVGDLAKCHLEKAKAVVIFASGQTECDHSDELSLLVTLSVRQAVGDRKIPIVTEIDWLQSLYVFPPHYSNGYSLATSTTIVTGADSRAKEHFSFASSVLTGSVISTEMLELTLFHNYFNPHLLKVVEALIGGSAAHHDARNHRQNSAVVGLSCLSNSKEEPFGERYIDVVQKFAAERAVVLGLYRVIKDGRHEELNGCRYMLTNPPPSTKLLDDDIVYYLSK